MSACILNSLSSSAASICLEVPTLGNNAQGRPRQGQRQAHNAVSSFLAPRTLLSQKTATVSPRNDGLRQPVSLGLSRSTFYSGSCTSLPLQGRSFSCLPSGAPRRVYHAGQARADSSQGASSSNRSSSTRRTTASSRAGRNLYTSTQQADTFLGVEPETWSTGVMLVILSAVGYGIYRFLNNKGDGEASPAATAAAAASGGGGGGTGFKFPSFGGNKDESQMSKAVKERKWRSESKARLKAFANELRGFANVDMSGRNLGDEGFKYLTEALSFNNTLVVVDFSSNGIGAEGVQALSGAKALAELLKKNETLTSLELSNNVIDYSGCAALAEALQVNKTLRSLHLNGNYGGALGADAISKGLVENKGLRELHFHGNGISDEGMRVLAQGLQNTKAKITTLDLGNNSIGAIGAGHVADYGAEKIAEALRKTKTLSTIDLGGNNIRMEGIGHICSAIKDNTSITTLELGYNPIGAEGAKVLADTIKFHGNVETLRLGWCKIGVKGAEHFAEALKYNSTMSTLDLRANSLGDEGAALLASSLRVVNEQLATLDLGLIGNVVSPFVCSEEAQCASAVDNLAAFYFTNVVAGEAPTSPAALNMARHMADCPTLFPEDKGAYALAEALKANGEAAVTTLNLSSNYITKYGEVALSEARDIVSEMNDGKEVNILY
eukprot:jgi/Mesen1/8053/ME000043S07437